MTKEETYRKIFDKHMTALDEHTSRVNNQFFVDRYQKQKEDQFMWLLAQLNSPVLINGTKDRNDFLEKKWQMVREMIHARDHHHCRICGNKAEEVHHILPRSYGGTNNPRNLICVCSLCHQQIHMCLEGYISQAVEQSVSWGLLEGVHD